MKKLMKIAGIIAMSAMIFNFAACSSDNDDGDSPKSNPGKTEQEKTTEEDDAAEVTLKIEESATGFASTTGSIKLNDASWIGYSGVGYVENLTIDKSVVYTITASKAISDAKIAIHYANWQNTNVRGAYIYVNNTLVNENNPISMTYTNKGAARQIVDGRWIDSGYLTGISLKKGSNTIIIKGVPKATYTTFIPTAKDIADERTSLEVNNDGQLSNIDYLIVVGKGISAGGESKSYYQLSYASENETAGTVTSETRAGDIEEDTSVTLSATANAGWKFDCWSDGAKENPLTITINANTSISAHFIPENFTALNDLVGYATLTADSAEAKYTICGGAGGETITINTLSDLTENSAKLSGNVPYIVNFTNSTRITTADNKSIICSIGSNKTIYGSVAGAGLKNIEMRVSGNNVIIRNLILGEVIAYDTLPEYKGNGNDALSLNGAQHVWVDHCELHSHLTPRDNLTGAEVTNSSDSKFEKDFYDGLLDLKNGASWVTISNCYFHDHWKAFLCGSGDDYDDGDSNMRLTVVGCYFKDINSRQPLFRWGKAHIYNNYFHSSTDNASVYQQSNCIDVRVGATVLAESNYFENVKNPIGIDLANSGTNGKEEYRFPDTNQMENCRNTPASGTSTYTPPYTYTPASASKEVSSSAGAILPGLQY